MFGKKEIYALDEYNNYRAFPEPDADMEAVEEGRKLYEQGYRVSTSRTSVVPNFPFKNTYPNGSEIPADRRASEVYVSEAGWAGTSPTYCAQVIYKKQ